MISSNVEILDENSFVHCRQLGFIDFMDNHLYKIGDSLFVNNPNLFFVNLHQNRIEYVASRAFNGSTINFLDLNTNNITDFSPGTFNGMTNLTLLIIRDNQLSRLTDDMFGSSLNILNAILASTNQISSIEEEFFDNAVALDFLDLKDNSCISETFTNIINNRDVVRSQLANCFGIVEEETIFCDYLPTACLLSIQNPS